MRKHPARLFSMAAMLAVCLSLFAPASVHAIGPICRVDQDSPAELIAQDGASWSTAYASLSMALSESACQELWVAEGLYKPFGPYTESFNIREHVEVYGGFGGYGQEAETLRDARRWTTHVTILSGDIDNNDDNNNEDGNDIDETYNDIQGTNSLNVVYWYGPMYSPSGITADTVLDGFTITGGYDSTGFAGGGGMQCFASGGMTCNPTLKHLVFIGNRAADGGGAVYNMAGASPTFEDVVFKGNQANLGGAVYNDGSGSGTPSSNPKFTRTSFIGNSAAQRGGAVYNAGNSSGSAYAEFTDSLFYNNYAGQNGGAVYNAGHVGGVANPKFTRVTFDTNSADSNGGAVYNNGYNGGISGPSFKQVTFTGNVSQGGGGAVYNYATLGTSNPLFLNVTFSGNTAVQGGAVYNDAPSGTLNAGFFNVTFSGNRAAGDAVNSHGGAIATLGGSTTLSVTLTNAILWDDYAEGGLPEIYNNASASSDITYSVVSGDCSTIAGAICHGTDGHNLSTDPLLSPLRNNGGGTWTMALRSGSSAIDTGDTSQCTDIPIPNNIDQRGYPRPADGDGNGSVLCDIGAYEAASPTHVFADVPVTGKDWMEPWIVAFRNAGVTTGCGANPLIYCPESNVTRAEMAVFLLRAKHGTSYTPPPADHYFSDMPVTGKAWMEAWVDEYYREGLTTGCGGGHFCPENNVTRAEMAVFVLRAIHPAGYVPPAAANPFTDVPVLGKEWMEPWIVDFKNHDITSGCGSTLYCPENNVTRAEMAVFIGRAYHLYP